MLGRRQDKNPDTQEVAVQYISPSEQSPEDMPQHRFEIVEGDEIIGGAEVDYFSRPLPLYQLSDLWVEHEYSGQGKGSRIMDAVEAFLKEREKPGLLVDAIIYGNDAYGMYERRGWQSIPSNPSIRVYNWPEHVSLDILKGFAMRQTPIEDREGFVA